MLSELVAEYLEQNRYHHFEGPNGVWRFERLVKDLGGYGDHFTSPLNAFFEDNPGAIEAVIEWIAERSVPEWEESLRRIVGDPSEESDEDQENS